MPDQARKLCELGATDLELAEFFQIDWRTLYRWKHDHPEFCQALKTGKDESDERVQRSLYHKALGFPYVEEQAFKLRLSDGSEELRTIEVQKFAPADTSAAIFWLKNRRKDEWRDKQEHEHSGPGGGPMKYAALNDDQLQQLIDDELDRRAASRRD